MKKTLLSLACVGVLASGLNAQNLEIQYYFSNSYNFDLTYKNYNNKNDLIFGGKLTYEDYGLEGKDSAYNLIFRGLVGKNLYLKQDGNSTFGVNLLGGFEYWRWHYEISNIKGDDNSIAPMVALNLSGVYDKNIIYDIDLSYASYFGDSKDHLLRYDFGAGYKFTENFYAKANVLLSTRGEKEKNRATKTYLGFTLGYGF